jgi:AcrR family transcriptional regulator
MERGPRARTRKALIDAAVAIAGRGIIPSVSDVAEAAQVSRATAYRYFPSQAVLVQTMVVEALGPIWRWLPESDDVEERVGRLLRFGYGRMNEYEASLRAALLLALEQWARDRAGTLGAEPRIVRGNRIRMLGIALAPLKGSLPKKSMDRLVQSLAIMFGTETMVVLKDMFGLKGEQVADVAEWAARALVRAALAEQVLPRRGNGGRAAKSPARRSASNGAERARGT